MLSSFFIRNFRSILELRLDFSYGEGKAPNGYKDQNQEILPFIEANRTTRLVPCLAFFGANASGKTNLLRAFDAFQQLIIKGGKLADRFEPNLLNPKFTETTFEIEFYLGYDRFTYRISYSAEAISEECLLKNGRNIFGIHQLGAEFSPQILSAAYSKEKVSEILRVQCTDGEGRQIKPFLNLIGRDYPGLHPDLKSAFGFFQSRITIFDVSRPIGLPYAVDLLASTMGNVEAAALREITDVVRRLDIDIADIRISETKLLPDEPHHLGCLLKQDLDTGARYSVNIHTTHQDVTGNSVALNFIKHESAGTQRLAGLIALILRALKTGEVLLVDELESSLHPLLMREIVLLFKKRRYNPKGAQLIFTTHNTDILDDSILRLSEIALVRKTVANGTLVRRLVDAKKDGEDIRNVTNFRKQYLAGFYSGVPHPAL